METDGLLNEATKIHSLVIQDAQHGIVYSCHNQDEPGYCRIETGIELLAKADELIGHNIMGFDIPVIQKIYPDFKPKAKITDTLLCSRLIWTDIGTDDHKGINAKRFVLPGKLIGSHSLEAWGHRLRILKGDFKNHTDWKQWSPEMQAYCEQDVRVTEALWRLIISKNYSAEAIQLEHDFAAIIYQMTEHGFAFDKEKAVELYAKLVTRKGEIESELQSVFPPTRTEMKTPAYYIGQVYTSGTPYDSGWESVQYPTKTAAVKAKARDIQPGPLKIKETPFNPGSRKQVADRLMALGWKPSALTEGGSPQVDESVLETLTYPEAKPLAEYFMLVKRLGQIAEGDNSWLKLERNGRIHGEVITNGAVTGRCSHRNPNVSQVPRVGSPYGADCRGLFTSSTGCVLVGADASGLELRCLAHYLGRFDGGEYVNIVTKGDVHTTNQHAFGLPAGKPGRQLAKNGIYCLIYGGSDEKLGETLQGLADEHEAAAQSIVLNSRIKTRLAKDGEVTPDRIANWKRGNYARSKVANGIKGYGELIEAVQTAVAGPVIKTTESGYKVREGGKGFLTGLDGRSLRVRSEHSALNTLLQSAGALLVKKATVLWVQKVEASGLLCGKDWKLVCHCHDEIVAECQDVYAERIGRMFIESVTEAGRLWNFRCPLSGEMKIGKTWGDVH